MSRLLAVIATVICLQACSSISQSAKAQTPRSVHSVPADAAFLFGLHNQAEMIRRISGSPTFKMIYGLIGDGISFIDATGIEINVDQDPDSVISSADSMSLLYQVLAADAFVYGDADWAATLTAYHQLSIRAQNAKQEQGDEFDSLQFFLSLPDDEVAKVRLPSTVVAFQLNDPQPAIRLLDQAHAALKANPPPPWALYRGKKPVGDQHMLVFTVQPWESDWIKVNWSGADGDKKAASEKLKRIIDQREIVMAVGVVDSRLVACFAENLAAVRKLVRTENDDSLKSIAEQADFKSLLNEQAGSLVASAYVSDDLIDAQNLIETPGLLASASALLTQLPEMISGPELVDATAMAMITTFTSQAADNFSSIADRWDELTVKPAGWSATIYAGEKGFSGNSCVRSIDPRLPANPLDIQNFAGEHVLAFYGWQSTTIAERLLLILETGESLIDAMAASALIGIAMEESIDQDAEKVRAGRAKLANNFDQLNMIAHEQLLPSLGDGGHAIAISALDQLPKTDEEAPVAISFLTRVSDSNRLQQAGKSLRLWGIDFVKSYYEMADEPIEGPIIMPLTKTDDSDSLVFRLPPEMFESSSGDDPDATETPDQPTGFHLRLSDQLLAFSSDPSVTKKMLHPVVAKWSNKKGVLRSVAKLDFVEIADLYERATSMVEIDEQPSMLVAANIIRTLGVYQSETRTLDGQTKKHWQWSVPLGD